MPDKMPARGPLWKWGVCGLLLLATMINYMDRQTLSQLSKRILEEMALDEADYGQLESAFAFAFAVGAIIVGWLADRRSARWLYPAAVLVWSAAGFATGLATGFVGLLVCRFLLGLAAAGNWPCALRTTQKILEPGERSMGNSILQSGAAVGAVVTPLVVLALAPQPPADAVLVPSGSWRLPFLVIGAVGLPWVVVWLRSVGPGDLTVAPRAGPSLVGTVGWLLLLYSADVGLQLAQIRDPLLTVGVKVAVGVLGIAGVVRWLVRSTEEASDVEQLPRPLFLRRFAVVAVLVLAVNIPWHFFRAWLPLFLQKQHGFSEAEMSWFLFAYYLTTCVGSLAAGFGALQLARAGLSVHGSRLAVFTACAALMTLSVPAAVLTHPALLLAVLLVIGFASLGLFPNYYSFTQSLTTAHQGKVTGSLGCINWLGMYVLQAGVGEMVKQTGKYSLAVALVGLVPLLGVATLVLFWGAAPEPGERGRGP